MYIHTYLPRFGTVRCGNDAVRYGTVRNPITVTHMASSLSLSLSLSGSFFL